MSLKDFILGKPTNTSGEPLDTAANFVIGSNTGGLKQFLPSPLTYGAQLLRNSLNKSNASVPGTTGLDKTTPPTTPTPPPPLDVNYGVAGTDTPHTDIQYTANKLNELSYGSSPMDLFSLRQRLARDQALAAVGQLPGDNANNAVFDGMGITDGTPNYDYSQRMGVNKATADIYSPQINALDDLIKASTKSGDDELTKAQKVNTFNKIVNEYNKSPLIRAAERTPVLSGTIDAVIKDPKNSALQLNLSYAYVQALDTYQSAVREGELNNLNSIDSKIGQIQNYVQKMGNGQIMRPEIAKQVAESAKSIVDLINSSAKQKAQSFRSQAQVSGIGDQWDQYTGGFNAVYDKESDSNEEIITDDQGNQYRVNPDGSATQILSKVGSGTKTASNRPQRNNNPLNIKASKTTSQYPGVAGLDPKPASDGGKFLVFNSPEAGFSAAKRLITSGGYSNLSVDQALRRWSGSGYGAEIVPHLAGKRINSLSQQELDNLIKTMAHREGYFA